MDYTLCDSLIDNKPTTVPEIVYSVNLATTNIEEVNLAFYNSGVNDRIKGNGMILL